jgi:hypothetical protein
VTKSSVLMLEYSFSSLLVFVNGGFDRHTLIHALYGPTLCMFILDRATKFSVGYMGQSSFCDSLYT